MQRSERVSEEMQKILSTILRDEIRDPRLPLLVSITDVKVTRDLSHANVYVSVYGTQKEKDDCFAALKSANSFIRREVVKRLDLRIAPELHFLHDDSIEKGIRMSKLIDDTIKHDKEKNTDDQKD
jgi:ribosome-binding factor A